MQWDFSPEDVVKARTDYGLEDFRRDLAEEIRMNLPSADTLQEQRSFNLIYDLCYALATRKELDTHLNAYAYDPPTIQFLCEIEPLMADNVAMLGAILQRLIMDRVEGGMSLNEAVASAASWHSETVAQAPLACT